MEKGRKAMKNMLNSCDFIVFTEDQKHAGTMIVWGRYKVGVPFDLLEYIMKNSSRPEEFFVARTKDSRTISVVDLYKQAKEKGATSDTVIN